MHDDTVLGAIESFLKPRFAALVAAAGDDDRAAWDAAAEGMRRGLELGLGLCGAAKVRAMDVLIQYAHELDEERIDELRHELAFPLESWRHASTDAWRAAEERDRECARPMSMYDVCSGGM